MELIHSPTQLFCLQTNAWEARHSLWVFSPSIVESGSGAVVFRFSDARWSMDKARWLSEVLVEFTVRRFPGDHVPTHLTIQVDCANGVGCVGSGDWVPLAELERASEAALAG